MLQQLNKILHTPKKQNIKYLSKIQDLILITLQQQFSQSFNLQFLHQIYQDVLGQDKFYQFGILQITVDQQIQLVYRLIQHFIAIIKQNYINVDTYKSLQLQTQKNESTIRSHIKIQQQMKMYLQYLQSKIYKITKQTYHNSQSSQYLLKQIQIMENRQKLLQKQKINLIKENQKLHSQINDLNHQLSKLINKKLIHTSNKKIYKQLPNITQKYQQGISAQFNANQIKQINKIIQEKQTYRNNAHDYDLTQKKKNLYFTFNN